MPGRYEKGSPPTQEDYTGHVKDGETGLHYAGARYYSSAFARWTTTDPILGEKGPKALLKRDVRLLSMSPYNYAFDNPLRLADPTGMAPLDWFKTKSGKIKYDEEVQSQADLEEGQTYLGESVLDYRGNGPVQFGTENGNWINVFDNSSRTPQEGLAIGMMAPSAAATKTQITLGMAKQTNSALNWAKIGAKGVGTAATAASFGLSLSSEISSEGDPFNTAERVRLTLEAGLAVGSIAGGAVAGPAFVGTSILLEATGGKELIVRQTTLGIYEQQASSVVGQSPLLWK